jgi:beta-mannosidase
MVLTTIISDGYRRRIGHTGVKSKDCEKPVKDGDGGAVYEEITYRYGSSSLGDNSTATKTFILFNGLDTFTNISFCGQHVASTDNQFRQYIFDVSEILASCNATATPELRVDFASVPKTVEAIANLPGQETWPDRVQIVFEFENRQFARKQQSDFGWDWGPAFIPTGIWQKAWIYQLEPDKVVVSNAAFDIYREGQLNNLPPRQDVDWIFNASIDGLNGFLEGATMRYSIREAGGGPVISSGKLINVNNTGSVITGITGLKSADYDLWWPVGMGKQPLYNITVDVVSSSGNLLTSVSKRTGFRTIVLDMGEVTDDELSRGIAPGNHCK